jgi:hypothetical protein
MIDPHVMETSPRVVPPGVTTLRPPPELAAVTSTSESTGPGIQAEKAGEQQESAVPRWLLASLRPLGIFVASRFGLMLVALATDFDLHHSLKRGLVIWDSVWYLSIAHGGYVTSIPPGSGNPAQSNLGFFPLLPLLTKITSEVTRLSTTTSGFVTVTVVGAAASVAIWWMLRDVFGLHGADRGTALIFFSPGAFVLSLVYSEATILLFTACALLALRRKRWVWAGIAAALATAADPVGSAAIVPCVIASVIAIRQDRDWRSLAAPLIAPLGIVTFFTYLWIHAGSPWTWFDAQRAGWQGGNYGAGIPRAFEHVFSHGFADPNYGIKMLSVIVTVGLLVVFWRAHPPAPWIGYVATVLAFGAISPLIGVTPRLLLRGFPLLGVFGARLSTFWFQLALGFSALCMAALMMMASALVWTP